MENLTGHHTCKKDGGEAYVLANAPFISEFVPSQQRKPFLGTGYYFWDYNLPHAKRWGNTHYKNNYYIVEAEINCEDNLYLNLAGNRRHMEYFLHLLERFKRKGVDAEKWEIGAFIEFVKKVNVKQPEIFPFQVIRAEDYFPSKTKFLYYFNHLENYINLSPRFIICILYINELVLQKKEIVYKSK